jgi:hypothetical protein
LELIWFRVIKGESLGNNPSADQHQFKRYLEVKLGEVIENYRALLLSKFQKKRICFVRVMSF